jgi:chemotaxis protein MotB
MNSKSKSIFYTSVFAGLALSSCVPQRKFDELKSQYDKCQETSTNCKQELSAASTQLTECTSLATQLKTKVLSLEADSLECFTALERTKKLYQQSEETAQRIIENSRYENGRLSTDLNAKNEALKNKERELHEQEASLISAQNKNRELSASLALREKRVAELEGILKSKDSAVLALKASIQKALLGFQNQGLSIEVRNGKVYVSMEEKLLFKSGSITVDPEGEKALMALAKALNTYEDVSILVEGHTDNVPMKSSTIKDNLDLSVLRATSITRLLTANGKVDPKRVTSAGRGEYFPIDPSNTSEARAKNRRTDIILTPKLDELLSILNSQ